jgi:hypothetical protein
VSPPQHPPRPPGVGRPGSGARPPAPERSISPVPETRRPSELEQHPALPSLEPPKPTIPVGADDSVAVRLLEASEARQRAIAAELAREKARADELERQSRVPELPSPKRDREHTVREWPPGVQPGQAIHVHVERGHGPESQAPKSARERAGDAVRAARQPLIVTLISTLLGGGGATAIVTSQRAQPVADPTAGAAYALTKAELERLAAEQRRQAEQQSAFQGWVLGYLRATGARIDSPAGYPAPTTVEIRATPAPTASVAPVLAARRRGGAPEPARVEVLTPPPPSLPPPKPPELPERLGP